MVSLTKINNYKFELLTFTHLEGFFFTDGELWNEQRRYTLQNLRQFGFGCRSEVLENEIKCQIAQYIDMLKNGPVYPHEKVYFNVTI